MKVEVEMEFLVRHCYYFDSVTVNDALDFQYHRILVSMKFVLVYHLISGDLKRKYRQI